MSDKTNSLNKNKKREQSKEKKLLTKKQKLLLAVGIILASLLLLAGVYFILNSIFDSGEDDSSKPVFLYPADYSEDIFLDPTYMKMNRDIFYSEDGTGSLVNEDNDTVFSDSVYFFKDYFDAVIKGDAELYKTFIDEQRYTGVAVPDRFSMQKVYDIEIAFVQKTTDAANSDIVYEFYEVRYKILYNNGTFRADISSKEVRPLMYTLIINGDDIKISAIEPITYVYD